MKKQHKQLRKNKGGSYRSFLCFLAVALSALLRVSHAQDMPQIGGRVSSIPNTVGAQSATLGFVISMPIDTPLGSKISVTVPSQTRLQESENVPCQIKGIVDVSAICKTNGPREISLQLPSDVQLYMGSVSSVSFAGVFFAPLSTKSTDAFKIQIRDATGFLVAEDDGFFYLDDLVPNEMQSTTISQVNSVTVGAPTAVYFSITSLNPIPAAGGVQIKLPKWNPKADDLSRESYVLSETGSSLESSSELPQRQPDENLEEPDLAIDYNKLCSPKRGILLTMECTYYATTDMEYITLTGLFEETREAGDTFEFFVSRLRNPISQTAVAFEMITFESIQEVTVGRQPTLNGLIDRGDAMFLAEQAAFIDLDESSIRADVTTVQEFSTFYLSFKVPVPVQEGCTVLIQLPDDFILRAGDLTRVQGWGIFGRKTDLSFGIDESSRIIKIVDQCAYYSGANTAAELEIEQFKNPKLVRTTKSFFIQVMDQNNQGVAELASGLVYDPTSGLMQNVNLVSLGRTRIEEVVDMRLDFTPPHQVYGLTALKIKMPEQMIFSCNFSSTMGLKTAPDCEEVAFNEFRLPNPFYRDSFDGQIQISITFANRVLPGANMMIKGITVQMVQTIESVDYVIDEIVDPGYEFFAPEQQLFLNSEIATSVEEVYSDTPFAFTHTLANNVPSDAIIKVMIPAQIEVGDASTVVGTCSNGLNLQDVFTCQLLAIEDDGEILGHELWVYGAFPENGLSRNQDFTLLVLSGLYTPLSMKTTDTFHVIIYDSGMHEINYVRRALSLTMKRGKDVGEVSLVAGDGVVGGYTDHKLTFKAPAPIYEGFLILVHIPEEVGPPMNQAFLCEVSLPISQDSGCRINGQRITVTVKIDESFDEIRIPIGTELSIHFMTVQSPGSTKPTSPYQLEIKTSYYQIVAEQHTPGPSVINTTPALILNPSFQALDLRQLAVTTITVNWINTQVYPVDLAIKVRYDPSEISPVFEEGANTVPCVFRQTAVVDCEYLEDEPGVIKITDMLIAQQNPGTQLQLTLTNQKIEVLNPGTTSSWQMTTYTDSSTAYSIDKIDSGLTFTFTCNLPCLTCLPNDPDYCLSCNQFTSDYLILHEGKCNTECPNTHWQSAYTCLPCDPKCKTCAQFSGSTCTSCYGGFSSFPFLYGNACVDQCIHGFYGNRDEAQCQTCVDPCETCVDRADKCTSCKYPEPGEPITQFYFQNKCLPQCPAGWVADEETRSNVCERCSDNCATCFGNKNQCATCPPGKKLNLMDRKCVSFCPPGLTVQQIDASIGGEVCQPCDSKCVTCRGSPTFCTSCQTNLSLLPAKGTCKLDCDETNFTQVSLNGNCVGCAASCKTCQYFQDNCLSCHSGKYFYANSCVDECPEKDDYQYVPNSEGVCIIPGIRCPFGYELTPTGNGCTLMAQVCIWPNELNYDMTSCVPGSDDFIPFPLLIVAVIATIVAVVIKHKKKETRFVATMIVFWSVIEFVGMIVVFYLASKFGIAPVVYMLLIAILLSVATNLFFFVVFLKQIMNDTTFFHWASFYKTTVKVISAIGLAFNFKVYRLLYSKMCGKKQFDAPFNDPYKFYTPLNLASFMNLLLVMLLCIVACVFGIYYVSWGYQLCVECAEFLIIEIIMIALYVIEYCQMRAEGVMKRTPNWKVNAKQVDRLKVRSGYEDELSDDGQDPDAQMIEDGTSKTRKEVKPKALKTIHTMEKVLAQLLVKKHAIEGGYQNTMQEIEHLHEKEIMLRMRRRCMSFRIDRPDFREAWGFESDEEDLCGQNHISEPGSPRSKEMLQNTNFVRGMQALSSAYHMRDQYDNCYAESRDPSVWPLKNVTQANKKIQTNVMELLGVDDLKDDTQTEVSMQSQMPEDFEYDPNQAAFLIDNVIARMDSEDNDAYNTNDPLNRRRRGSDPNAENYSQGGPPRKDPAPLPKRPKRKRKQLTKRRMAELPSFHVSEILGEFEVDEQGNQIILQTANGKLNDKYGRQVNRRGYLVDPAGNIITRGNVFIFYKEEIDFDDEIPAPFCFRKQKKNVKFSVRNFNAHRRMRRKDKLAMQDEFVEREYQKLKQAARERGSDVRSQQISHKELGGIKKQPSEKVNAKISSMRGNRKSSRDSRRVNQSGVGLLNQSESSHLGDVNLSNMILQDREGGDYYVPNDDGMTAEQFQAKNSTNVKRKPPRNPSSHSRRKTEEDEKFIDEVTAPMRAKTKNELLGTIAGEIAHSARSMGSAPRSHRSRSNEKSQKSRHQYQIKDGKMLNISSQRSLDKQAVSSDQHASQADMMAMPTAGGEPEDYEHLQPRNLDFDTSKPLNISNSGHIKSKKRSVLNSQMQSRTPSHHQPLYDNNQQTIDERQRNVVNDEAFIKKVAEFNDFLNKRKVVARSKAQPGQQAGLSRAATAGIIDDTFLNPDGSVRQIGLAHKNLNQVYGRVRTKFNQQIRSGSHALKFRPQGSSFRNRIDDNRRVIAGMNYNQRERQLMFEINNLIDRDDDALSLSSVQRKLFQYEAAEHSSAAHSSPTAGGMRSGNRRDQQATHEKMQALRSIYSDYRLDSTNQRQRIPALSPQHPVNSVTFEASKILESADSRHLVPGRQMDQELRRVQKLSAEVRSQIEGGSAGAGADGAVRTNSAEATWASRPVKSTNNSGTNSAYKRKQTPHNILEGKFL